MAVYVAYALGRSGNGDVEVALTSVAELPYIMGLVRQSFENQMGSGGDAYEDSGTIGETRSPSRENFYKCMTARVAKVVLTTRRLRWSSPLLFNDPFDVTQELRLNFDEQGLDAALNELSKRLRVRCASPLLQASSQASS